MDIIKDYVTLWYQDWLEAGGQWLLRQGIVGDFWIDLRSEEALSTYKNLHSDKHPQVQMVNNWLKERDSIIGENN